MEKPSEPQGAITAAQPPVKKRAPTLYVIIGIKLLKGLLLLLLAVGVYMLRNKDLSDIFDSSLRFIHLDPERKFFSSIDDWLDTVTSANVKVVASGTFFYGVLLLVEGIGLACRARWAVWLVIGQSAFFIPVEIYEYVRHGSLAVLVLLLINVFIMWYLFQNRKRLFPPHHHH
ncbi:MAG TPA: DUF2127 domain-containing protein [Verrucomicrobiae bacterium]